MGLYRGLASVKLGLIMANDNLLSAEFSQEQRSFDLSPLDIYTAQPYDGITRKQLLEARAGEVAGLAVADTVLEVADSLEVRDRQDPEVDEDLSWQADANCLGVDSRIFFPTRTNNTKAALAICGECSVREQCREYALTNNEEHGVWGGLSYRQRLAVKRQRKGLAAGS